MEAYKNQSLIIRIGKKIRDRVNRIIVRSSLIDDVLYSTRRNFPGRPISRPIGAPSVRRPKP